jgi:hypothetical protein
MRPGLSSGMNTMCFSGNDLPDAQFTSFYQHRIGPMPHPSGSFSFQYFCTGIHHTDVVKYVLQFVIYTFAYVTVN